ATRGANPRSGEGDAARGARRRAVRPRLRERPGAQPRRGGRARSSGRGKRRLRAALHAGPIFWTSKEDTVKHPSRIAAVLAAGAAVALGGSAAPALANGFGLSLR